MKWYAMENNIRPIRAILDGVLNKYSVPQQKLENLVSQLFAADSHEEVEGVPKEVLADLSRQIETYRLVTGHDPGELYESLEHSPILTIYRSLSGSTNTNPYRVDEFVHDFGGVVPTPTHEIGARLDELERMVRMFASFTEEVRPETASSVLAQTYSAIIRIHPFPDGNGRTGRYVVWYLLSSWGKDTILIPKVRNDPTWKQALDKALQGDLDKMSMFLLARLAGD